MQEQWIREQGIYRVQSGNAVFTYLSEKRAREAAKRIGLARCEVTKVIAPNDEVVYEF